MIPWPRDLPDPGPLDDESERDATPDERAWVHQHVQPECQHHDLVAVRAFAARLLTPVDFGGGQQVRLGVVIIGRRWVRAVNTPRPITMWYHGDAA